MNILEQKADNHTRCPECRDQLLFCNCTAIIANEILAQMELEKLI